MLPTTISSQQWRQLVELHNRCVDPPNNFQTPSHNQAYLCLACRHEWLDQRYCGIATDPTKQYWSHTDVCERALCRQIVQPSLWSNHYNQAVFQHAVALREKVFDLLRKNPRIYNSYKAQCIAVGYTYTQHINRSHSPTLSLSFDHPELTSSRGITVPPEVESHSHATQVNHMPCSDASYYRHILLRC